MKLPKAFSLMVLVLLFPCATVAAQREDLLQPRSYHNRISETLLYRLFVPKNYDRHKKYPLVLYLHGGGGSGTDNLKQIEGGNGYLIDLFTGPETQKEHACFVVAPQSPRQEGWIEYDSITPTRQLRLVFELIVELQKTYPIDGRSLYVAGQSMGGFGTFAMVAEHPHLFAAAVSVCGGGDETKANRFTHTLVWAFHGERDAAVNVERSRKMTAAINNAGGRARYTEYAGEGHLIWSKVVKEPELLRWLFSQRQPHSY
ncbi:MAG: prolyl oligopeptidase family serine peptidase [bacterium]